MDGKVPKRLFGPNLLDPSLRTTMETKYFSLNPYSARINTETKRSVNSQDPVLFKYPPCVVFAEISA